MYTMYTIHCEHGNTFQCLNTGQYCEQQKTAESGNSKACDQQVRTELDYLRILRLIIAAIMWSLNETITTTQLNLSVASVNGVQFYRLPTE